MKLLLSTIIFILLAVLAYSNEFNLVVEFGPKQLSSFEGIGDQVVFHWPAYNSSRYLLQFGGTVNQSGSGIEVECADLNVTALVRQNAVPVPNPRSAFLPDNTIVQNNGLLNINTMILSAKTQGQIYNVSVEVQATKVTDFFATLFLPYDLERFDVAGLTKDCRYHMSLKVFAMDEVTSPSLEHSDTISGIYLRRQQHGLFNIDYQPSDYFFNISSNNETKFFWEVYPLTDSGGTLVIEMEAAQLKEVLGQSNLSIVGCLSNEVTKNQSSCSDGMLHLNNSNLGGKATLRIPFPSSGVWTLSINMDCGAAMCSNLTQTVSLNVLITACIDGCEASMYHGSCGIYRSDAILFAACRCKVGWMGLACNDGRNALSYATQLLHTLLLTLSNIMFLPCVALAVYRKFYTESLVYFFVAFMSSFYHACDQPGQVVYCILPYETLQFSDFVSSITAIWFTLIALAKLPLEVESFLQVLGLVAMAVCVSFARFNVWTTVVPALIGVIVVVSKWGFKCHKSKKCYPGRKKTLFSIVPGVICAGVGLCLYAFVETSENYYIVHSIWHILMATAVLFLLPVGPKRNKAKDYKLVNSSHTDSPIFSIRSGVDPNNHNDFISNL